MMYASACAASCTCSSRSGVTRGRNSSRTPMVSPRLVTGASTRRPGPSSDASTGFWERRTSSYTVRPASGTCTARSSRYVISVSWTRIRRRRTTSTNRNDTYRAPNRSRRSRATTSRESTGAAASASASTSARAIRSRDTATLPGEIGADPACLPLRRGRYTPHARRPRTSGSPITLPAGRRDRTGTHPQALPDMRGVRVLLHRPAPSKTSTAASAQRAGRCVPPLKAVS